MDERIIAIIEDQSKGAPSTTSVNMVRVGSDKAQYDIIFTDSRIIAATVFSQSDLSDFMPAAGFQSMFKWKKTREKNRQEFKSKTPDEILNMHKDSYELPYEKIKSIKIKKGLTGAKIITEVMWNDNVEIVDMKIPKKKVNEVQEMLNTYLSSKVVDQ